MSARARRNLTASALIAAAGIFTVAMLAWILSYVVIRGVRAMTPRFFVSTPPGSPAIPGGGFLNGILGTLEVTGIAFLIAAPAGVMAAIWLSEFARGKGSAVVRFTTDVLAGVPTIVLGAFIYAVWVTSFGFSGFAGALALALVMLPLVIRSAQEALRQVPRELREASLAMGAGHRHTIIHVTLPAAVPGILTGLLLAVARAAGETAPLLLTALGNELFVELNPAKRMSTLSLQIFTNAVTGFRAAQARAWAGALTLVGIVFVFGLGARTLRAKGVRR